MKILIYQDYIHNNVALFRSCANLCTTSWVDAHDIIKKNVLASSNAIFIMPGGASRFYAEKLDGAGNIAIQQFIAQGGTYVGICAGAYYAATQINWQPIKGESIQRTHQLGFFNGMACGPLNFENLQDDRNDLPTGVVAINGTLTNHQPYNVLYWAGPAFDTQTIIQDNWQVLACYSNSEAAIIAKNIGLGRVILCSPHIEYSAQDCLNRLYTEFDDGALWQAISRQINSSLLSKLLL